MSLIKTSPQPVPEPSQVGQPHVLTLWQYMRPIRARWLLGCAVAISASIIGISIPQVLAWIVNHLVGSAHPTVSAVWTGGLLITAMGLAQAGLLFVRRMLVIDTASQVENTMRMALFDHLMRATVSFHDRWSSGQLLTRATSDLSLMRRWIAFGSIQSIASSMMVLTGLFYLFRGSWLLGLIYLCSIPLMVLSLWFFIRKMKGLTRSSQEQSGDLATTVEESVQGIRVLKALGQGRNALGRFTGQSERLMDTEIQRAQTLGSVFIKTFVISAVTMALALWVGLHEVSAGQLSVGKLTAFFATTAMLTPQIERSAMLISIYLDSKVAMERHREIMGSPVGENIVLINGASLPHVSRHDAASLEFSGASFSYADSEAQVLCDINMQVAPGEILALVGPTGCRKSTLLQLIHRLYELDSGQLLLDGKDVATMDVAELRSQISFAFEEPILFSSSVRDNVLLGVSREGQSEQELEELVRTALRVSSSDFVAELPDGVDTLIGEEGMSLSGGQRQRLSLARAIAANPRVLLLDDPLSALDVNTEEAVVGMLKEQLRDTTTLITAHRPSTVALADQVAMLDDGRIVAVGTHQELMQRPDYARLMLLHPDNDESVNVCSPRHPDSQEVR